MNLMGMLGALKNPGGYIMQMAMQQMIQSDPKAWQMTKEKFGKLSKEEAKKELQSMYDNLGEDLNGVATQCGIPL